MLESGFNQIAGLKACNFIITRPQHRCFPENFAKLFKNTYFEDHLRKAASGDTC